ncbi:hypothetical protein [Pantoea ananatis]|uniref:hypothetical protein n=1 Tax=Pantoea ananas TaxID=553 RepID=UPI0007DAD140|nr:hypothetical protein [Pantoea ananatis]UYL03559.1 hypothetical protein NG830_09620 [Pantoea ananatis]
MPVPLQQGEEKNITGQNKKKGIFYSVYQHIKIKARVRCYLISFAVSETFLFLWQARRNPFFIMVSVDKCPVLLPVRSALNGQRVSDASLATKRHGRKSFSVTAFRKVSSRCTLPRTLPRTLQISSSYQRVSSDVSRGKHDFFASAQGVIGGNNKLINQLTTC